MAGPDVDSALGVLAAEYRRAAGRFEPMHSTHEGYAVLQEEIDELNADAARLWSSVKADNEEAALQEAIHVGAMALRFLVDLGAKHAGAWEAVRARYPERSSTG